MSEPLVADKPEPLVVGGMYKIKGEKFNRASNFNVLDDRYSLEKWQCRMVGSGLILRPDLAVLWAAGIDDKNTLNDLCEQSIEAAKGHAGANIGTALHSLAEQVDRGENPIIPAPYDADIAAYTATLEKNGVRVDPALMELVVVNRELGVAGRYDRLVTIDGYPLAVVADLKTGSIDFAMLGIAVQLSAYAYSDEVYDPVTDTLTPMPRVDLNQALVIHLPAGEGTCTLYMVDIKAGWEAAQLCRVVRDWRKRTRMLAVPFESTSSERAKWLANRVSTMKDRYPDALTDLAARWPAGVPTFKQGGHSEDHLLLLQLLISDVEARHNVEFEDGVDPELRRPAPSIVEGLLERVRALPADLVDLAAKYTVEQGIPLPGHRKFLVKHVEPMEQILGELEAAHHARDAEVVATMRALTDGDVRLVRSVLDACGITDDGSTFTRQQTDILQAIYAGFDNLWLGWDEHLNVGVLDGEHRLVELFGSKKDALAACKTAADAHGLTRPKSVAEAAANPALVAVTVASAATNSDSTTQGDQAA